MTQKPTIVALNGSPHAGIGNTSLMIEMLREPLIKSDFDLEVIELCGHQIEFCSGCGVCMDKGKCWIPDDHRNVIKRLLAADGIVLASPVYFLHVTAQMKAFIDRSLAYGHKPRTSWKPGLAISVSAGNGETRTANYLADMLRPYGAFSIGTLTAMAVSPGEFVGQKEVALRAEDLANDLVRAIREKRRYPATDKDLGFYQFMSGLVSRNKDRVMKDDYEHWQQNGLLDNFEGYVQQETAAARFEPEFRRAWVKEMIASYRAEKRANSHQSGDAPSNGAARASTCKELLQSMPQVFNADASDGLEAIYQFEVNSEEDFCAYLKIRADKCSFQEGTADDASVVIKTPASVWLAVAKGEMDGQQAFMNGKYTVEGDLELLMKLSALFAR